jgi:multiple sugar transport system ATP-binding protein
VLDSAAAPPDNDRMALVAIENLTKIFPGPRGASVCALDNLSLKVESGEFLVLVGPSGSGKTTALRLIAGLEEATRGTISIDGKVLDGVPPKDRDIAMVFQNGALYPHMTARENLAFGLKLRHFPRAEIEKRVEEAAAMLGLGACLERKPQELSGGQRQRVALGRALVRQPKVFLFDEPLANLDPPMRLQLRAELSRLHTRLAATMIYVTHDQVEAMTLGDRIVVLKDGVLQQAAGPMEIYERPANLFVAGFFGSPPMNFFRGTVVTDGGALLFREKTGNGAATPDRFALRLDEQSAARVDGHVGKNVVLGIRPEAIRAKRRADNAPTEQIIEAVVEVVEPLGSETWLHLSSAAHTVVARFPAAERARVNEKLSLVFEMRAAHFFDAGTGKTID